MKDISTKKLTMMAMFMALTTVATMMIQIPIPATKGYLNVGDTVVIASALLMGKMAGGLIGGHRLGPGGSLVGLRLLRSHYLGGEGAGRLCGRALARKDADELYPLRFGRGRSYGFGLFARGRIYSL